MLTKCLGCENLEIHFRIAPKVFAGPCSRRLKPEFTSAAALLIVIDKRCQVKVRHI